MRQSYILNGRGRRRAAAAVLALILALLPLLSSCGTQASNREGPHGAAFYRSDEDLGKLTHGDLIWSRPYSGVWKLDGVTSRTVLYAQAGVHGATVATSGLIMIPKGKAPAGGWPVVTWAHGTTGIGDDCAPSRYNGPEALPGGRSIVKAVLQRWVDSGHAVVMTDYEGLGTPGLHPYLIGPSEGKAMMDIVRAARQYSPDVGTKVLVAGNSQGGHAALWANSVAPGYTPDLKVVGTVAFAPPSHMSLAVEVGLTGEVKVPAALILYTLRALDSTYSRQVDATKVLNAEGLRWWPGTITTCIVDYIKPGSLGWTPASTIAKPGADLAVIKAKLDGNDPSFPSEPGPILIVQGQQDTIVPEVLTNALALAYQQRRLDLTYLKLPRADHMTGMEQSAAQVADFTDRAFATS